MDNLSLYAAFGGAWLVGACATMAALTTMGERSRLTFGDSFSGDDTIDTMLIVLWPLFWPCWVAFRLSRRLTLAILSKRDK